MTEQRKSPELAPREPNEQQVRDIYYKLAISKDRDASASAIWSSLRSWLQTEDLRSKEELYERVSAEVRLYVLQQRDALWVQNLTSEHANVNEDLLMLIEELESALGQS